MGNGFINAMHFGVSIPNWQVCIILSLRHIIDTNIQ